MSKFNYSYDPSWSDFKKEYRYGAFLIFPPKGIIERVNELRKKYDPVSFSTCEAHISLSEPLMNPLTDSQIEELKKVLTKVKPFQIHYGPLRIFPPYPGVTFAITPEDKFMDLRSIVHSTSIFTNAVLKRKDIPPHMTIAESLTMARTYELLKELSGKVPEGDFLCNSIEYAIPNKDFYFERVLTIPFSRDRR